MDSTACLIRSNAGSDAPHVDPSFQFLPAGQRDMEQDNPISCHRKLQASFVAARPHFFRFCKPRTHTRMRHVSFNRNVRPGDRFGSSVSQLESDRGGAHTGRFRRDFVFDREKG